MGRRRSGVCSVRLVSEWLNERLVSEEAAIAASAAKRRDLVDSGQKRNAAKWATFAVQRHGCKCLAMPNAAVVVKAETHPTSLAVEAGMFLSQGPPPLLASIWLGLARELQ